MGEAYGRSHEAVKECFPNYPFEKAEYIPMAQTPSACLPLEKDDDRLVEAIATEVFEQFGSFHRQPTDCSKEGARLLALRAVQKWKNVAGVVVGES